MTARDTLARVFDVAALSRTYDEKRGDGAGSVRESRRGWLALRLAELTEGRDWADRAIAHFDDAIMRDHADPAPWVGLAEAKLLLEHRHQTVKHSMHQRDGVYYEDAALDHLVNALRLQPEYPRAVRLLDSLLVDFDAPNFPDPLVQSIRLAAAHPANGPTPDLLLARYYRKTDALDSAAAALDRYVALGGDSGLADLERARVIFRASSPAKHRTDGIIGDTVLADSAVALYLAGTRHAGSLARQAYRRDLTWVASPQELAAFDALPADSVGAFVRLFWAKRDAAAVRPAGERLREQLRRWWYVQDHFRLVGRTRKVRFGWGVSGGPIHLTDENEDMGVWALFAPGALPQSDPRALGVDDRGVVYMRHGEPVARASAVGRPTDRPTSCFYANESWKYDLPTGPIILHFCDSGALGTTAATTLVAMLPFDGDIMSSRIDLDTRYGVIGLALPSRDVAMANGGPVNKAVLQQLYENSRAAIRIGLTTDDYPLSYRHDLEPVVQIYAVSDSGAAVGRGRAPIVFALPGDKLTPEMVDGRTVYPVAIRVAAVDTGRGQHATVDTLRRFVAADTLGSGQDLYGAFEVPLAAGNWYIRVLFEQAAAHAGGARGRPDVGTAGVPMHLAMSDLITGREGSGLAWHHAGRTIPLNPLDAYPEGAAAALYYELTGTAAGGRYRTTVDIARLGHGGKARDHLSVSFSDQARGPILPVQRTIDLGQLGAGRYLLTVTAAAERDDDAKVVQTPVVNIVPRR